MKVTQIFGLFVLFISYNCANGDVSELKNAKNIDRRSEEFDADDLTSNNINDKQDEPPFTVLSGKFDPRDSVETVPGVKPYYYEKPQIPFEVENRPSENVEQFSGYQYPKPNKPFPPPTSTTDDDVEELPPASARIIQ